MPANAAGPWRLGWDDSDIVVLFYARILPPGESPEEGK